MKNQHFKLLEHAARLLRPLGRRVVFVGGASVSLHLDDPAVVPRHTKDVDVVVEVTSYSANAELEQSLRSHKFSQSLTDDGPMCRWHKDGLMIDVIPTEPSVLGFKETRWFKSGFECASSFELPNGEEILAFDALHLIAAKIEAFGDRGDGDWLSSQDVEDIVTLLDGRGSIFDELSQRSEVGRFAVEWLRQQKESGELIDMLGALTSDYSRGEILYERLEPVFATTLGEDAP